MIDVTRSSQFIVNSLKVYENHFEIFFHFFRFLLFFSSNCNLFSLMRAPIQFLVFQEIKYLLKLFFTYILFVGQCAFF